jgi:hypothetical protein
MDKFKIEHDAARLGLGAMFEGPLHNNSRGALCDDILLFVLEPFPFGNPVRLVNQSFLLRSLGPSAWRTRVGSPTLDEATSAIAAHHEDAPAFRRHPSARHPANVPGRVLLPGRQGSD